MLNVTNIPAARVPFVDSDTGLMTREWYRFFYNIFILSGDGTNQTTLTDLQVGPPTEDAASIVQNLAGYVGPDYQYQFQELANNIQSLALEPPILPQTVFGSVTSVNTTGNLTGGPITSTGTLNTVQNPTFTTSVISPLIIGGTSASSSLTLQSTSGVGTTDSILFKVGNNGATTAMTVDTSGNVGIGCTPSYTLDVRATTGSIAATSNTGTNYAKLQCNNTGGSYQFGIDNSAGTNFGSGTAYARVIWNDSSTAPTIFYTNGTERAQIDSSGNLLAGADNAYTCGGSGRRWSAIWAANALIQTSDKNAKMDVIESPLGLDFINVLRPVAYKFKVGGNKITVNLEDKNNPIITPIEGKRQHFGLIAQEVKASLPEGVDFGGWVYTDMNDPNSEQGLRYDEFISPLIKAIQELSAKNDALAARLAALEDR